MGRPNGPHIPPVVAIRREDPPAASAFGRKASMAERYADELAKVKADPGNWYAVLDYGERTGTATSAANRANKAILGFDFLARNGVLYAKYVGGAK